MNLRGHDKEDHLDNDALTDVTTQDVCMYVGGFWVALDPQEEDSTTDYRTLRELWHISTLFYQRQMIYLCFTPRMSKLKSYIGSKGEDKHVK